MTQQQKSSAVKAFTKLYPIFQDERCLNCHGAVNPFSPTGDHGGGWVNIREAARKFLEHANLPTGLVSADDASRAVELRDMRELAAGRDEDMITSNDLIRSKYTAALNYACNDCHLDDWDIPVSHNYFVGRSSKQICMHIKKEMTGTEFLGHMQEDRRILLGFKGQKALKIPTSTEPPAMPFNTMVQHANDWFEAMNKEFPPPTECGCEVEGIALEIRHRLYTDPQSKSSQAGYAQFDGTIVFDAALQREEGEGTAIYRGDFTVVRPVEVRHTKPSFWKCAGSGEREESWRISAFVDEEKESMQLHFSFVEDAEEASWTCTAKGHTTTDPVNIDVSGIIKTFTMSTKSGSVGEISDRNLKAIESFTITVIDSPVGQKASK